MIPNPTNLFNNYLQTAIITDCSRTAHLHNSQEEEASERNLMKIRHNANECRPLDAGACQEAKLESAVKPKTTLTAFATNELMDVWKDRVHKS